jgi:hypothetical protein
LQRLEAVTISNSYKEEFDGKGKARCSTPLVPSKISTRHDAKSDGAFQMWQSVRNDGVHPPKHSAHPVRPPKFHNDVDVLKINAFAIISDDMSKRVQGTSTSNLEDSRKKKAIIRSLHRSMKECQKQNLKVEEKQRESTSSRDPAGWASKQSCFPS